MKAKRIPHRHPRTPVGEIHAGSEYTDAEREFILAMDRFKRIHQRRFPTCCDVLRVIHELGYRKDET